LAADDLVINSGDIASAVVSRLADAPPSAFHSMERERMIELLENCGWDTARLAFTLGVHRTTIYRRMQRLGITLPIIRDRGTEVVLHG
jgi:transcriptional regulator of acetoin/glycerol metabolism